MNLSLMQLRFQRLRDNKLFELFVISVIILSSLLIGVRTYALPEWSVNTIWLLDYAVTLFFLAEIIVRMIAEGNLKRFFSQGWNVFDFVIVVVSLLPIQDSEYALVARLLRLFRVMRLISFIPELRVLVSALFSALPRMGYVALLMFIIFYIYAVVGNLLFAHINPVLWGDLGISLLTLFRVATFEDWTDVMYETMAVYSFSWIYYLTFIFFSAFVFLNMMIGIVLEVLNEEHEKMVDDEKGHQQDEATLRQQKLEAELAALHQKLDRLLEDKQH